jgi:hypothetical protein
MYLVVRLVLSECPSNVDVAALKANFIPVSNNGYSFRNKYLLMPK